jgi:hypothetical protein
VNFPLRTFKIGVNSSGSRVLHLSGCKHVERYKEPPEYWWTDEHALSLYLWAAKIGICSSCLPRKEIEGEYIPFDHLERLEPVMRQRRIEKVLA